MAIGKRREGRQAAMQFLFAHDVHGNVEDADRAAFWTLHSAAQDIRAHAESLVTGIQKHQAQIDECIGSTLENFRFERLGVVDRNILRLAVYEMFHTEVPVPVVINEAIEISKVFGDTQTRAFVNGVLDKIARKVPARPAQSPSAPQP
ncbi:MAG: transcription antitermination factor NusB [Verrucomicrobium sp.]|nr:transcription antitermination factor NusB [Verrucomicrobium sp.]